MGTAVLELPKGVCAPAEIGSLGAFFETSASQDTSLGRKEERLIHGLVSALDTYLLDAISARSAAEFCETRKDVWPKYVRGLRALQDTVRNLVPEAVIELMSREAISSLEADLQKQGEQRFGAKLADQALFTLWTLGKIRALGREIVAAGDPAPDKGQGDLALLNEYRLHSLWSQFHLDSLVAAMKFNRPLSEDVRDIVCEGLRAAVNGYAVMKDALALRIARVEDTPAADLPWDEEDDRLLASSMRDVNAEYPSDC